MLLAVIYYIAANVAANILAGGMNSILFDLLKIIFLVLLLLLYKLRYRNELPGFFRFTGTIRGTLLGWSMLLSASIVAINHVLLGQLGSIPYAFFCGFVPGFSEEVIFRILPLALVMRRCRETKELLKVSLVISICFGLIHGGNALIGANPTATLLQVLYAIGIGMLLSGIYLKTECFWPCIILHTWVDTASSFAKSMQEGSGVLTQSHTTLEILILLAFTVAFYVNAFMVARGLLAAEEEKNKQA